MIEVINLGNQPMSNSFLREEAPEMEMTYPLVLFRCLDCELVQIEKCAGFNSIFKEDYVYYSSDSPSNVSHAKKYCDMMMATLKPKSVMEIGSNDGYMLQHFKAAGCEVLGVDPSGAADKAKERGIPTDKALFDKYYATQIGRTFDLICGINVLNHQPYINDFVMGLKKCLAPDGIITFEFPHLYRMLGQLHFDTIYHEHLNYYSLNVITAIFAKHDLDVFHAEELTTHGGSFRIYARHKTNEKMIYLGSKEYARLIALENSYRLKDLCDHFLKGVIEIRNDIRSFVNREVSKNHTIMAYGAAAKASVLFNFCGLDKYDIPFVVDRSPHKIGKFLPGSHVLVVDEEMLKATKPQFVLITAWNLTSEIMKQLSYVREWGARFITVVPRIKVL